PQRSRLLLRWRNLRQLLAEALPDQLLFVRRNFAPVERFLLTGGRWAWRNRRKQTHVANQRNNNRSQPESSGRFRMEEHRRYISGPLVPCPFSGASFFMLAVSRWRGTYSDRNSATFFSRSVSERVRSRKCRKSRS